MTNLDKIKALLKLSEENPTLSIKVKVDTDVISEKDHWSWYTAYVGDSYVADYWEPDGEYMHIDDQIIDELCSKYESEIEGMMPDKENEFIDTKYAELKAAGEIKTAIFLEIVN